jgi:hypothetical protein
LIVERLEVFADTKLSVLRSCRDDRFFSTLIISSRFLSALSPLLLSGISVDWPLQSRGPRYRACAGLLRRDVCLELLFGGEASLRTLDFVLEAPDALRWRLADMFVPLGCGERLGTLESVFEARDAPERRLAAIFVLPGYCERPWALELLLKGKPMSC